MNNSPLITNGIEKIASALNARLPPDTEKALQAAIGVALLEAGVSHDREFALDGKSRIDFLTFAGIGIEAKIGGGRRAIWRQLQRYAAFDAVKALVLVGTVAFPANITQCEGKPFRFVSVGKGWM